MWVALMAQSSFYQRSWCQYTVNECTKAQSKKRFQSLEQRRIKGKWSLHICKPVSTQMSQSNLCPPQTSKVFSVTLRRQSTSKHPTGKAFAPSAGSARNVRKWSCVKWLRSASKNTWTSGALLVLVPTLLYFWVCSCQMNKFSSFRTIGPTPFLIRRVRTTEVSARAITSKRTSSKELSVVSKACQSWDSAERATKQWVKASSIFWAIPLIQHSIESFLPAFLTKTWQRLDQAPSYLIDFKQRRMIGLKRLAKLWLKICHCKVAKKLSKIA